MMKHTNQIRHEEKDVLLWPLGLWHRRAPIAFLYPHLLGHFRVRGGAQGGSDGKMETPGSREKCDGLAGGYWRKFGSEACSTE